MATTEEEGGVEARKLYSEYRGPGPQAYKLKPLIGNHDHDQTKSEAPAYSISLPIIVKPPAGPGPSTYVFKDTLTSKGTQDVAAVTLKSRTKLAEVKDTGPAPGDYDLGRPGNLSTQISARAAVIGQRYNVPDYKCSPGPTAYGLPGTVGKGGMGGPKNRKPASWSLRGRQEYGSPYWENIIKNNPGPSNYARPEPTVYQRKPGVYSMQGRTKRPVYNTSLNSPAPGAYNPGKMMGGAGKGPSMGTRHSKNVVVCLTMADTVY